MLYKLETHHINQIVEIHASAWNENEFSVKLGRKYLKIFYSYIAESSEAIGYVSVDNNKKIIAYATGFIDYAKFNENLKRRYLLQLIIIVLARVMQFKLSMLDVYAMFQDDKKTRNIKNPKFHLGALAINNEYKSSIQGFSSMTLLIKAIHKEFIKDGGKGCWGACDDSNPAMKKLFECMGYKLADKINLTIKKIAVYEKLF